jgi:hypothetical protein
MIPDFFCDPGEARTLDPMIKSHLLYQLSYRVILNGCKGTFFTFYNQNIFSNIFQVFSLCSSDFIDNWIRFLSKSIPMIFT